MTHRCPVCADSGIVGWLFAGPAGFALCWWCRGKHRRARPGRDRRERARHQRLAAKGAHHG